MTAQIDRASRLITLATATILVILMGCKMGEPRSSNSDIPKTLEAWMRPQHWVKKSDGPAIRLGSPGEFDDMHVFAPCVWRENGHYFMLYPGSRGNVAERVFRLGLATSSDGVTFKKSEPSPVFEYGDDRHSVVTPTLLRDSEGRLLREDGKLRMWFSAVDFQSPGQIHTLHDSEGSSVDQWSPPSPPQLEGVYAPTIIKENGRYRMWYTDFGRRPLVLRYAESSDGIQWTVNTSPVLVVDQPWEADALFYPAVVKADGAFLMWYGAYWRQQPGKTAIGLAVSTDGIRWYKNPHNPVLTPDPDLPWESDYNTSHSILRLEDQSWRIWYGSRKAKPHINKYFAITTAHWTDGFIVE